MEELGLDPVSAARTRIKGCEQHGMEVDERDREIGARAEES